MRETVGLIHSGIGIIAGFVFFIIGVRRAFALWGEPMPQELRILKRIEAIAYIVLSEVITIHLYVKWS